MQDKKLLAACIIGGLLCGFLVIVATMIGDTPTTTTDEHVIYEDDYFHLDYQIDLKQDHYIIINECGERYRVELGELEEFFIQDNL